MSEEYIVQCWNCLGEFDAVFSVWCSCDPRNPTKLCPYCLQCFCQASDDFKNRFWKYAPPGLLDERAALRKVKDRLGELLVRAQFISVEDLLSALKLQAETGEKLGQLLVNQNLIAREDLDLVLHLQAVPIPQEFNKDSVDLETLEKLNAEFCFQRKLLPLSIMNGSKGSYLVLAMASPQDTVSIEIVSRKMEMGVIPFYAEESAISSFLASYVPPGGVRIMEQESSEYQLAVRKIIIGAIKRNASDIHIEPDENDLNVRYRIDGILYRVKSPPKKDNSLMLANLKKMAKMEPHNNRIAQASKMVLKLDNQRYQLNVFCYPHSQGERISIKIVNLSTFLRELSDIGFSEETYPQIVQALDSRSGLILISAPLMNGCNTTQYAMMKYLSGSNRKVMTLESPIFSYLENVTQTEINPSMGTDFAAGLNAIVQQQPDVVFLSDIPDAEVAAAALILASRSLVIATMNAISASNAIGTLLDIGASPSFLASSLILTVNQRLVRRICAHCCQKSPVSPSLLILMGLAKEESRDLSTYAGLGCPRCNHLGFNGRLPIFEVLPGNEAIARMILQKASAAEIEKAAVENGMLTLRQDCLRKVNEGLTTIEEFQKAKF